MPKLPSQKAIVICCSAVIVAMFITLVVLMTTVEPQPLPDDEEDGSTPGPEGTTSKGRRYFDQTNMNVTDVSVIYFMFSLYL